MMNLIQENFQDIPTTIDHSNLSLTMTDTLLDALADWDS